MVRPVMREMASTAPGREIGVRNVRRPMVAVRACQNDTNDPEPVSKPNDRLDRRRTATVSPRLRRETELAPSAVWELVGKRAVSPSACLATAAGAIKPNAIRDRRPVDRIERAEIVSDRHAPN